MAHYIDVEKAEWIPMFVNRKGNANSFQCSGCKWVYYPHYKSNECNFNYCPNCGKKMNMEASDDEI